MVNKYRFILFLLILSFAGCKTKQKISNSLSDNGIQKETDVSAPKKMKPQITSLDYEWLSYRINVSILDFNTKKETQSVSAFYVNKKDSIIYITLSKFFEVARVVLTPDSVKYIDYLHSTYYVGDYSFISRMIGFNVNFKLIQAIFAGEDIPNFEPNTFLAVIADTSVYTSDLRKNKQMNMSVSQVLKTNSQHKIIENSIKVIQKELSLSVRYSDFTTVDKSQLFFQQADLFISSEKMLLNLRLKDVKVNIPTATNIHIPQRYKPLIEIR